MKKVMACILAVFLLLIFGCSKTENQKEPVPEPGSKMLKSQPVPLSGHFEGYEEDGGTSVCTDPPRHGFPPHVALYFKGNGHASHCGKSTMRCDYCESAKSHTSADTGLHYHGYVINGNGVITASNGDLIYLLFTGSTTMCKERGKWINHLSVARGYIVGGTGKFNGARGTYQGGATQDHGQGNLMSMSHTWSDFWLDGHMEGTNLEP